MASDPTNCGAWCATAQLEDGSYIAIPMTCHSWRCPSCARHMRRRLLRRLAHSRPNLFATLTTSRRTAPTPDEAFKVAAKAVGLLIKRWRRRYPHERVEYYLVWETTKAGWYHAHLLLAAPRVSRHWLSRQWRDLTGSYIIDLQPVSSLTHAVRYVSKYLGKDMQAPAGRRRWCRSAGFFRADLEDPPFHLPLRSAWRRRPRPALAQAYFWLREGLALDIALDGTIRARDDPAEHQRQMGTMLPYRLESAIRHLLPYMTSDDYS